jgi:hypothetical protein
MDGSGVLAIKKSPYISNNLTTQKGGKKNE